MRRIERPTSPLVAVCASYAAFGMPIAMLGAGWPEVRHDLGRPSSALGLVATAYGLGRLSTSTSGQALLRRWAIGSATAGLLAVLAVASLVVAVGRSFPALVGAFALIGMVSGGLDALGSRYQTVVRVVRDAGLMFGAYGVGATVGPAVVAVTTWTTAYLAATVVAVVAAAIAGSPSVAWPTGIEAPVGREEASRAGRVRVPRGPLVLSLLCFAAYCALEVTTAGWTSTYLEEHRGASATMAGLAVSGFWAGITLGRLVMGRIPASPSQLLVGGGVATAGAYLVVPFVPTAVAVAAVVVAGAALAVVLPTLVVTTADRVGVAAAGPVTGWQMLAANIGGTACSGGMGFLVARTGDGAPILVLIALALVGFPVLLRALAAHPDQVDAEEAPAPTPATP